MKDRIRQLRRALDLTQREFAERIGMKSNTIATYEMGRAIPSDPTINNICKEFGANEEWLRTGEGEMLKAKPTSALDALARDYNLRLSDYVLIEKLLNLSEKERDGIFRFMSEVVAGATAAGADPYSRAAPGGGAADAEAAYEKSFDSARNTGSSASNTTGDTEFGDIINK